MAGEEQYYSPIIQAMIASQRTMQDKANLAERVRSNKVDESHRQQQLDQLTNYQNKQLEIEKEAHDAEAEWRKAQAARQLAQDKIQSLELIHKGFPAQVIPAILSGAKYNPGQQGTGGPGVMGQSVAPSLTIGGQEIPTDLLPTPQKEAALKLKEAEDALRSKLAIEEPFNVGKFNREQGGRERIAQMTTDRTADVAGIRADAQREIAGERNASAEKLAELRAQNAKDIAMIRLMSQGGGLGTSDEVIGSYLNGLFGTGDTKESAIGEKLRPGVRAAGAQRGFTKTIDKKDIEGLKNVDKLEPIFQRYEQFANMLPSGNGLLGKAKALGTGILSDTKLSTQLKTKQQEIMSDLQNVAKQLEGFSGARPLLGLFEAEKGAAPSAYDTKENALDKIKNLRDRAEQVKKEWFKGFSPQQAQFISDLNDISLPKSAAKRKVFNPQTGAFEDK